MYLGLYSQIAPQLATGWYYRTHRAQEVFDSQELANQACFLDPEEEDGHIIQIDYWEIFHHRQEEFAPVQRRALALV